MQAWLAFVSLAMFIAMNLVLIVSGILLLRFTKEIKSLFDTNSHVGVLDIRMLLLHGSSFGLFLIGTVIFTLSCIAVVIFPESLMVKQINIACSCLLLIFSFCSQCLLCVIFVGMSRKKTAIVSIPTVKNTPKQVPDDQLLQQKVQEKEQFRQ